MRLLYTAILVALLHSIAFLNAASGWEYAQSGQIVTDVLMEEDGDVISGGLQTNATDEIVVVKHSSADGTEQWRYSLNVGGPTYQSGVSVAQDASGGTFAASYQRERDGEFIGVVAKLSSDTGGELWRTDPTGFVGIHAISVDVAGDLFAAGAISGPSPSDHDLIVLKLAGSTGVEIWRYVITGSVDGIDGDTAWAVAVDSAGDVYAGGRIYDDAVLGYADFFVVKLSGSNGSEIWRQKILSVAGHGGRVEAITLDHDGNVIPVGQAVTGVGWCDWVVAKLDPTDGEELWRAVFDEGGCDKALAVSVDPSGDIVATGGRGLTLFVTMKFSGTDGSLLWRHDIENLGQCTGGGCALGRAVAVHANGDAFVVGTDPIGDFIVARLKASDGDELWRRVIDYDGCGDSPWSLAVNPAGNLAIGGSVFAQVGGVCAWPQGGQYAVIKLNGDSGDDFTISPELAQCQADLEQALAQLDQCLLDPTIPDEDDDGIPDWLDACPSTAPSAEVDQGGCSLAQFCALTDPTTKIGRRVCKRSDWKNDEPHMPSRDRDCHIDKNGPGREDDQCTPVL